MILNEHSFSKRKAVSRRHSAISLSVSVRTISVNWYINK